MKIFAVILHFGDSNITNKCLKSVLENEKEIKKIVIVNNDSSKFKIQPIRQAQGKSSKLSPKLKIINNKKNLGYAGGMNMGIKYALSNEADYILLLNNDTILEESFLKDLIKRMEGDEKIGIGSPAVKFKKEGKVVYDLGGRINMLYGRTRHDEIDEKEILRYAQNDELEEVDYVSGCCMLIKKEVFKKVGFFDENFFLYYEDVDFCLRSKRKGFKTIIFPSLSIFHDLSKTTGKNSRLSILNQTKSALIFGKKHLGSKFLFNFLFVLAQSLIFSMKNPRWGFYSLQGIGSFLWKSQQE